MVNKEGIISNIKLDWNDISLVPEAISEINSRSEVDVNLNGNLPIFTAPMDTVIDESNTDDFVKNKINVCYPRNVKWENVKSVEHFYSYGIDEIDNMLSPDTIKTIVPGENFPKKVLIDLAQGHLKRLYEISKKIKEYFGDSIILMVGNIANPKAYEKYCEIGVDMLRIGIGGGSACTTSANASIHYPMASLISECYDISKKFENPTKIIADGGFRNFSDIIKALALGADYVMIGGILNKTIESCSKNYEKNILGNMVEISKEEALHNFNKGSKVYKYFRGMSTKEVQRDWNKSVLKTSEGITKYNEVETSVYKWSDNFEDYLKSAMSYTNSRTLKEFKERTIWIQISNMSFNRFNK